MKKVFDIGARINGAYLASLAVKRKIKRYWGTEDSPEGKVFTETLTIYPHAERTANTDKLLKMLNSYDSIVNGKYDGIERMWLYLNPDKLTGTTNDLISKELFAEIVNDKMTIDEPITYTLNIAIRSYNNWWQSNVEAADNSIFKGMTSEQVGTYIRDNYESVLGSCVIQPVCDQKDIEQIGKYILLNTNINDLVVSEYKAEKNVYFDTQVSYDEDGGIVETRYAETYVTVSFEVTRVGNISSEAAWITRVMALMDVEEAKEIVRQQYLQEEEVNDGGTIRKSWFSHRAKTTNEIWYQDKLRVSVYDSLKNKHSLTTFMGAIDQGYQKKKVKWYKKLLVIIVVIAIIYFTGPAGGYAAMSAIQVAAAIAWTATMVALGMTAVAMYGAKNGEYGIAAEAGQWGQVAGKIALVTGVIAGIGAIQQAWKTAAEEAAKKEAAKAAAKKVALELAGDSVGAAAVQTATASTLDIALQAVSNMTYSAYVKTLGFVSQLYQMKAANEIGDIQAETQEVKDKQNALAQEQAWNDQVSYTQSLNPVQALGLDVKSCDRLDAQYYQMFDGVYEPTRFNVCSSGTFKGIGVFDFRQDKQ